jgi:hypothetical protein
MKRFIGPALAALAACAPPALAEEAAGKAIVLHGGKAVQAEVYFHRTEISSTGIIVAGLIGAAIEEGVKAGNDGEKTKAMLARLPEPGCNAPLLAAMMEALKAEGTYAPQDARVAGVPTATIAINECGLRLVDTETQLLAAFIDFEIEYGLPGKRPQWTESIQFSGRGRHAYDAFLGQEGLAQQELADALKRAGVRAANKIIYAK